MQITLKDSEYTFDATNKEITLVAPYDKLSRGQVISIVDLSAKSVIYLSHDFRYLISIVGAVITHATDNSYHVDTDKLQIIIDTTPSVTTSGTGTTANAYANALEWVSTGLKNKGITLKNTHATNDLKFKVLTYRHPSGQPKEFVAETTLAATKTVDITLNDAYALIEVAVKSAVADTHATYQIDKVGNE